MVELGTEIYTIKYQTRWCNINAINLIKTQEPYTFTYYDSNYVTNN